MRTKRLSRCCDVPSGAAFAHSRDRVLDSDIREATIEAILMLAAAMQTAPADPDPAMTGLRVEATVGYDEIVNRDRYDGAADAIPDTLAGLRAGLAVGYDVTVAPRLLLGAEIGIGRNLSGGVDVALLRDRLRLEAGRDYDVAVRLAWFATPRMLVYGKIGRARSRLEVTMQDWVGGQYETNRLASDGTGWRFGTGVEQRIVGRLFAKAEYRRTRSGDDNLAYQEQVTRHQLLAGVGVRF